MRAQSSLIVVRPVQHPVNVSPGRAREVEGADKGEAEHPGMMAACPVAAGDQR